MDLVKKDSSEYRSLLGFVLTLLLMKLVDDYLNNISNPRLKELALFMHHFILTYPGIKAKISFGIPFYYGQKWICYLNITKQNQLEWAFTRAKEMNNTSGLLQFKSRKLVAGITMNDLDDLNENTLDELMQDALRVDQKK
jgi:hypothetical protein